MQTDRRQFVKYAAGAAVAGACSSSALGKWSESGSSRFKISLAQWSQHRALKGGQLDALEFAPKAKSDFGVDAVEYVNQFFKDKVQDQAYLRELKNHAEGAGVKSLLIMVDGEGALGDADSSARQKAIDNHVRWLDAAKFLGCHSIRVNAQSSGSYDEQRDRAADGLRRLADAGFERGLNVIVENHGGLSSNGAWLSAVIRQANRLNCGTLPDFGNFNIGGGQQYDRYQGVAELMPYAKAVSAKSHDFDAQGNETATDYPRMMRIVLDAGYRGYVGIEYEGHRLSEPEGILATKRLLERIQTQGS
jgi:sugar phosphate isomerase/epimerase